jgi:fucose permease
VTQRIRTFLVLAFGFVLLGIGLTATGVAWPSVAEEFDRSLAELGYVSLLFGGGYTASTLLAGWLTARAGIRRLLIGAALLAAVALTVMATSATWPIFLIAAGFLGAAGGLIDAATNTYIAIRRGARAMGFIHGSFGIGAIAGPLLVTGLLQAGFSWRAAFAALAVAQVAYGAGLWFFARHMEVPGRESHRAEWLRRLVSPTLVWSVVVFFLYAGIAAGAGVWAFTLLTEERGIATGPGGIVVAAYWAAFTASRFLLGLVGDRADANTVLRWSAAATAAGFAVFWWNPATWIGVGALIFTGFAHGPVFPLEMLLTPRRFGAALTATVVGFEIAGANVGGAVLPGLIGFFVDNAGLAVIPPLLVVNALVLWVAIEALRVSSKVESKPVRVDR